MDFNREHGFKCTIMLLSTLFLKPTGATDNFSGFQNRELRVDYSPTLQISHLDCIFILNTVLLNLRLITLTSSYSESSWDRGNQETCHDLF